MRTPQKGFTLMELMVSITLGSIMSAAAITLYLTAQKTYVTQESMASSQTGVDRGVQYILEQVRKAGHGQQQAMLTAKTPNTNIINGATNYKYSFSTKKDYISGFETGPSYVNKASDQLVIKYTPTVANGFDCEGNKITSTTTQVVERYFVRKSDNGKDLSLACDAGRYTDAAGLTNMGGDGVELIQNVDFFHIVYTVADGVGTTATKLRDVNISEYKALTTNRKIVGVKIGLISHSSKPIGYTGMQDIDTAMQIYNKSVTLNSSVQNATQKYMYSRTLRTVSLFDGSAPMEL